MAVAGLPFTVGREIYKNKKNVCLVAGPIKVERDFRRPEPMASSALRTVIRHLHRLLAGRSVGGLAEADLLERFVAQRDEAAFEVLVWRHGPMVWNVCQRLLHHTQDTEDAFQATFLAFVREAHRIRERTSLSSWLYKVAYRVALKAKARAAQKARRETQGVEMLETPPEDSWQEIRPVLDEEVNRLPLKYRLPFVLCYLQGKTTDEAAQELGCARGTIATRLAWARERLRKRLTQRGLALSTGALATLLSQKGASATLPAVLVHSTVRSALSFMGANMATGASTASSAALAQAVLQAMTVTKMKLTTMVLLASCLLATGIGLAFHKARVANQPEPEQPKQPRAAAQEGKQPKREEATQTRTDRYGDPLPPGALARLGTLRWRALGEVEDLAFAPDDKVLVSASPSGAAPNCGLCFFDVASGKRINFLCPSDRCFQRMAYSPDGTRLACYGTVVRNGRSTRAVQIWELPGGRKIQEFEADHLQWVGWSAASKPLVVLLGKEAILIKDLATGKERQFKAANLPDSRGLDRWVYTDRGRILAIPDDERLVIQIWDTASGEKRWDCQAQGDHFLGRLALSLDGRWLASLTQDAVGTYYVQLWDVATSKAAHRAAVDQKYIAAVAFSPDGKLLATIGWNDVRFWDVITGQERSRAQGVPSFAPSVAFSSDGKTLATVERYSGAIHLWDVGIGARKPEPSGHTNGPYQVVFSPDGQRVASGGGMDGTIFVWDPKTGESLAQVGRGEWVRGLLGQRTVSVLLLDQR
jgi:RNA polymerase sigma factor (sigma-70 family)